MTINNCYGIRSLKLKQLLNYKKTFIIFQNSITRKNIVITGVIGIRRVQRKYSNNHIKRGRAVETYITGVRFTTGTYV